MIIVLDMAEPEEKFAENSLAAVGNAQEAAASCAQPSEDVGTPGHQQTPPLDQTAPNEEGGRESQVDTTSTSAVEAVDATDNTTYVHITLSNEQTDVGHVHDKQDGTMQHMAAAADNNTTASAQNTLDPQTMQELSNLPDQNEILEKLTHIRNCKRNVLDMLDKMKKNNSASMDKEMVANLVESYDGFKEQEDQFMLILERTMALKQLAVKSAEEVESIPDLESSRSSSNHTNGSTNSRPIIEGALRNEDMNDNEQSMEEEEELGEMRALQQQRDLLRKMVEQQKKMKEIQAKRDQMLNDKDGAAQEADAERRNAMMMVSQERESIAAKQLELSSLKSQLDHLKKLCVSAMDSAQDEEPVGHELPEVLRAVQVLEDERDTDDQSGGSPPESVEGRLRALQTKKSRMDTILDQISSLSNAEARRVQQRGTANAQGHTSEPGTDLEPDAPAGEESDEQLPTTIHTVKRQLDELGSVKDKLLDLQELSKNLQEAQRDGGDESENERIDEVNRNMRANYERKLDEQKRALEELQAERCRLLEVKDQLMRMHGADVEESPQDSEYDQLNDLEELNNAGYVPQQYSNRLESPYNRRVQTARASYQIERPRTGLDSSAPASVLVQQRRSQTPLNSMVNVEPRSSEASSIISNPRIASFRRNNLFDRPPSTASGSESLPSGMAPLQPSASHCGQFRDVTPSVTDFGDPNSLRRTASFGQFGQGGQHNQYQQLQDHMNSIQNIFQQMSESRGGSVTPTPAQPDPGFAQQAAPMLQQQQLIMSLMTCQQQLQMQQVEMQQLQNVCQQLAHNQQLQSSYGSDGSAPVGDAAEGAAPWMMHPSQFDSRPLSSQSLYNLLAPNPYLVPPQRAYAHQPPHSARPWQSPGNSPYAKQNLAASWHQQNAGYRNRTPVSPVMSMSEGTDASLGKPPSIPKLNLSPRSSLRYGKQSNLSARSRPRTRSGDNRNLPGRAVASARAATVEREPSSNESRASRASEGSQFESLREVIYSEVATLISQNEERPQFLVEMFRDMQLLGSDYMRTKAVQSIRALLTKYLDAEGEGTANDEAEETEEENNRSMAARNRDFASFLSTTQGDMTDQSDTEVGRVMRHTSGSGSSQSTPGRSRNTVVHVGSIPSQRSKRFENIADLRGEASGLRRNESPLPLNNTTTAMHDVRSRIARIENRSRSSSMDKNANNQISSIDVGDLEKQIEAIVDELIPVLRHNASAACTPALLQYVRKLVMTLTASKCSSSSDATTDYFHRQLSTILDDTLAKYAGRKLAECGEELLTDVSEVVFNELAFSTLMNNINNQKERDSVDEEKRRSRGPKPPIASKPAAKKFSESSSVVDMRRSFVPTNTKKLNASTSAVTYKISLSQSEVQANDEDEQNRKSSTPRLPTVPKRDIATAVSGQDDIDDHVGPILQVEVTERNVKEQKRENEEIVVEDLEVVNPYPKAFTSTPPAAGHPESPPDTRRQFDLNGEPHPEDHRKKE